MQELLGPKNAQTTMIYTHVAINNPLGVRSPVDNVVCRSVPIRLSVSVGIYSPAGLRPRLRHGPVDQLKVPDAPGRGTGEAPAKECPECLSVIAAGYARCPECGYAFPSPQRQKHDARAGTAGVLSGQVTDTEYEVLDIRYSVHTKRDAPPDAPKSMRVEYRIGRFTWVSEWVCFEHTAYAPWKAEQWWRRRSPDPVPDTAQRAVEIAEGGGVAWTEKIVVRSVAGEKYDRIVGYTLGRCRSRCPLDRQNTTWMMFRFDREATP